MVRLSERAIAKVRSMQAELGDDSKRLRVFVEPGGCSGLQYGMKFDVPNAGDIRVESGDVTIVLDPESYEHLKETLIEFDDGLNGKGFEMINPAARSTCGCGKSFS